MNKKPKLNEFTKGVGESHYLEAADIIVLNLPKGRGEA